MMVLALLIPGSVHAATAYRHAAIYENPEVFPGGIMAGSVSTRPQQMAIDSEDGRLFIADHGLHKIHVFAPDGETVQHLTSFGDASVINRPIGIVIDPTNNDIYVTAAGNPLAKGLVRFTQDESLEPGDPDRYVHDAGFELSDTSEITDFGTTTTDSNGRPVAGGIALAGEPNPATARPDLLLLDPGSGRVHRFDSNGEPVLIFPDAIFGDLQKRSYFTGPSFSARFIDIRSIATDDDGNFTVADTPTSGLRVRSFSPGGALLDASFLPLPDNGANRVAIGTKAATGEVFVVSHSPMIGTPRSLFQYEPDGALVANLAVPESTGRMSGVTAGGPAGDGRLYVTATSDNNFPSLSGSLHLHVYVDEGQIPDAPSTGMNPVDPADVGADSVQLSGSVNPNGGSTRWRFEYRRTDRDPLPDEWQQGTLSDDPITGSEPVQIEGVLAGLEPATPYQVRLFADNGFGKTSHSVGPYPEFETKPVEPVVTTGRAWQISSGKATIAGTVDARNAGVEYHFEYGTNDDLSGSTVPVAIPPADRGGPLVVSANLSHLKAATEYSFRLVAVNTEYPEQELSARGEVKTFHTRDQVESAFSERGYELVSRPDTNGLTAQPAMAAEDGNAYVYRTFIPSPGAENARSTYQRMSRADDGTWHPDPYMPAPPFDPGSAGSGGVLLSAGTEFSLFPSSGRFGTGDQNDDIDMFIRSTLNGDVTWVSRDSVLPSSETGRAGNAYFLSPDGRYALFGSSRHLVPEDRTEGTVDNALYEWHDGRVRLVSIRPKNDPADADEGFTGAALLASSGATGEAAMSRNPVSTDRDRIVFTARQRADGVNSRLYIRHEHRVTHQIGGVGAAGNGATFEGADSDVRTVIYSHGGELYAYNTAKPEAPVGLKITPTVPGGAGVTHVLAVADDADRIYFRTSKSLDIADEPEGPNLYLAERESSGGYALRAVAPVDSAELSGGPSSDGSTHSVVIKAEFDADPDGDILAFRTTESLIPGRDTGGSPQIYVYEADRDELSCISCPTDGSAASQRANLAIRGAPRSETARGSWWQEGTIAPSSSHVNNVSSAGSVFFQTATPLVAGDANEAVDVYEWRGGELRLVSAGRGVSHSYLAGASSDGETVFMTSSVDLAPGGDVPNQQRIYAARIGGGTTPAPPEVECHGAECRGPSTNPAARRAATAAVQRSRTADRHATGSPRCQRLATRTRGGQRRVGQLRRAAKRRSGRARVRTVQRMRQARNKTRSLRLQTRKCRGANR